MQYYPLFVLAVGIVTVIGMIVALRINAFIALITAAIVVSLMSPGDIGSKISRVASAFGGTAGGIGIVIALAAVIGKCMMDSGAADRVVRFFLRLLGEKRGGTALMSSGFVLAIPVFFDTVFYLLVPLARSMHRRTGRTYLKYILAIGAGGAITHTLVPPTPGPLVMADQLGVDLGVMILVGLAVAIPAAIVGLWFGGWSDARMNVPMRPLGSGLPEPDPLPDAALPSLFWSLLPVLLPVVMISTNTVLTTIADGEHAATFKQPDAIEWPAFRSQLKAEQSAEGDNPGKRILSKLPDEDRALLLTDAPLTDEQQAAMTTSFNKLLTQRDVYTDAAFGALRLPGAAKSLIGKDKARMKVVDAERMNRLLLEAAYPDAIAKHEWATPARQRANVSALFGNANLALLISAAIAMGVLWFQRKPTKDEMAHLIETSLMSGGVIILITAAGGAFGAMLKAAQIGDAIESMFGGGGGEKAAGLMLLCLGFVIAAVLKIAQGSSTVAMITASSMLAAMIGGTGELGFNTVYLATAVGAGSLVVSWMNDSGFWIFAKMGGLTEVEALKSWTVMLAVMGVVAFIMTCVLAMALPLT